MYYAFLTYNEKGNGCYVTCCYFHNDKQALSFLKTVGDITGLDISGYTLIDQDLDFMDLISADNVLDYIGDTTN